ncbi:MAG TPA: protease inhibitor I42 family protein [bacterium]
MKKNPFVMCFLLIILMSVPACGSSANGIDASLELTDADSGGRFTLRRGDTLRLSLRENGTTGYGWEFESRAESILVQVGEDYVLDGGHAVQDSVHVGGGGTRTYTFKALQEGEDSLRLVYRRPWLRNEPPADIFEAAISVE